MKRPLLPLLVLLASCGNRTPLTPIEAAVAPAATEAGAARATPDAPEADTDEADGGDEGPAPGTFTAPTQVIALSTWTPVHTEPRRESSNQGYLRAGAVVNVVDGPHGRNGCPVRADHPEGGWYKIEGDGYVCVGGAVVAPYPARGFRPPLQPAMDASMPYPVAINYGRTVMYRRPPTMEDLHEHEPWRFQHATPADDASAASPEESSDASAAPRRTQRDTGPRDVPQVRLSDLAGEHRGPMIRRLLTGMYVALDRQVHDSEVGESYWRTQSGGFIRTGRLSVVHGAPTFHGMVIDAEHHLPAAFMVSETGWVYRTSPTGRGVSYHRRAERMTGFWLSDEAPIRQGTQTFWRTTDGFALHEHNIRRAALRTPPEGVGPTERWIDVDLDEQVLVAYEGPRPVYVTLVSSGRRNESHPERDHATPAGSFRIESKHISITMDGDTPAEGPYSIEDVPWVMYFHDSFAIHGAFWHNYFGWRMSHGCVNLSPPDARWMFLWADPQTPAGWHGIYANDHRQGSRVELRHSRQDARDDDRPTGANINVPH